jgi:hypothetical protein
MGVFRDGLGKIQAGTVVGHPWTRGSKLEKVVIAFRDLKKFSFSQV